MTEPQRAPIGGRYQVLTTLGRGGMGVVYKAHDPVLERDVAIKQMSTSLVDNDEHRRRFHIEARAAARLNHPNIVTIYELEEHQGDVFIIMELLEGLSLGTLLQRGVTLPLEAQLSILAQVADGLDFAHARAIVHRDIKPANLVLLPTGVVKILDFGIAQLAASGLTKQGALLGTPNYMAPEQVRGEPVDARADLFSAGAVAYELVSGVKAFSADSVPALLLKIAEAQHAPLAAVAPRVAPALAALVDRLLAKERDDRPARGADVRAALEAIGPIDRLDLIADAVALALSPSEGDTLVQFPMPDRHTTPVASRSSVSSRTVTPSPQTPAPPPLPPLTPPATPRVMPPPSSGELAQQITQNLGPKEPAAPAAPPPLPLAAPAPEPAVSASSAPPPLPIPAPIQLPSGVLPDAPSDTPSSVVASSSITPSTAAAQPQLQPLVSESAPTPTASTPAASTSAASTAAASTPTASTSPTPTPAASTPPASTPPASTSSATPTVGAAVPAARRAGNGTAIVVLGLAAALAGVFIGASYMWWQRLRAEIKPRVTTESTATPSTAPSSSAPASESSPATAASTTEATTPGETPAQTSGEDAKPGDAPVESTTPAGDAPPATSPPATSSSSADATGAPATSGATTTSGAASEPPNASNASNASNTSASNVAKPPTSTGAQTPLSSGSTPSTTRERVNVAPPANNTSNASRTPARTAVNEPRTFREPAPPVDTTQPPPPDESDAPPAPPTDSPARAARSGPPPRTAVDAETVGAFRRSGGDATAVLGGDQTMMAAAAVRIKDTIERYGAALQARDADAVRGYRDSLSLAEQRLLDGAGATVRFADIDVDVEAPTQATARARRTITPAGQPATSETVTLRLVRKPSGWIITSITR